MTERLRIWEEIIAEAAQVNDLDQRWLLECELEGSLDRRDRQILLKRLNLPPDSDTATLIVRAWRAIRDNQQTIRDVRAEWAKTLTLRRRFPDVTDDVAQSIRCGLKALRKSQQNIKRTQALLRQSEANLCK